MSEYLTPRSHPEPLDGVGDRLRSERMRTGISQRELARRLGLSPSLISQVESGLCKPSVATLWAIVTELDVSLDRVFRGHGFDDDDTSDQSPGESGFILRPEQRETVQLASGVLWEDLTIDSDVGVDFVLATYEVGGASTPDESLMRHRGREYGYVLTGTLGVQVDIEDHVLEPGDSIAFYSTRPHRLYNVGNLVVRAIWFVIGGGPDDGLHIE